MPGGGRESLFAGGRRPTQQAAQLLDRALARAGGGPAPPCLSGNGDGGGGLPAIRLRDVVVLRDTARILDGISLEVPAGSITVVLGPSGVAKGELIEILSVRRPPDGGEVWIDGVAFSALRDEHELEELQSRVGVGFRDGGLLSSRTLLDNVAFPLRDHLRRPAAEVLERSRAALVAVGLENHADRLPGEVGMGMRKRAGFARALVADPAVALFDEPDSGVDPVRAALLGDLLVQLRAVYGTTFVVFTQSVALARQIADRLVVLWRGRVLADGPLGALLAGGDGPLGEYLALRDD